MLHTLPQSKVYTRNYGPSKLHKSQFREFQDSQRESLGTKWHLGAGPWPGTKKLWGGRWWLSPSSKRDESCESVFARGSFMHQKCFNYALTNLFNLCRSVWIINLVVTRPSPHPRAPTHPSTLEMLWTKECTPTPYPFVVFTFGFTIESIKEVRGVSLLKLNNQ